jgi:pilus assembly protein CpaB
LEKGLLAVSVVLGDPQRVAGFVQPGSKVAVFVTTEGDEGRRATKLLLPTADVAAVGPTTAVASSSTQDSDAAAEEETVTKAILTLGLTQEQAQKLIFAQESGNLYFALLNESSKVAPAAATVSVN